LTLNDGERSISGGVIDPSAGYAYFGTFTSPGQVVKVGLPSGANPPVRIGALSLIYLGEEYLGPGVIDPLAGFAYFSSGSNSGQLTKVALGNGVDPPTRIRHSSIGESPFACATIDLSEGYAYLGVNGSPGRVAKVDLSLKGSLHATAMTMPEGGVISEVRIYSHRQLGHLRAAIYDDQTPRNLLWQSNST
ncbi:MAG: hypothetical protein KC944_25420, partial [Candidatus Omnitrophica bacterium]|nr:hypothetical protein [Candidatus Omnitrophota bacterium]